MSRIGRMPIAIPAGVTVEVAENNKVTVKGPKGTLERVLPAEMEIKVEGSEITVARPNDLKKMKSLHGLTRTLINNMVVGVTQGYEKKLEVNGVGYRAAKSGNKLTLSLGYSHPVEMIDPEGIETVLDGQNIIIVKGIDKEKVGQFAAEIRDKRRPEPYKAQLDPQNDYIVGKYETDIAVENGLKFHVDWLKGQKTGFFVDQRDNRSLLEHYAKGRTVLNMFCYTGGFSFYAMRGGAKAVHSVDSSEKAVRLTNANVELNFPGDSRHKAFAEDAFKFLGGIDDSYDLIILDPPAFAKHKSALKNALIGYRKLNVKAFEKIRPGGILFTFSCSQAVSKEQFRLAVFSAAAMSGRKVRILHQLTQPSDHPINIYHPEGEYLKGLVLYVE